MLTVPYSSERPDSRIEEGEGRLGRDSGRCCACRPAMAGATTMLYHYFRQVNGALAHLAPGTRFFARRTRGGARADSVVGCRERLHGLAAHTRFDHVAEDCRQWNRAREHKGF